MSEIHVAVGSYVVNALDDAEREEFEAHLSICESCQREVVEFSETTAQLAALSVATPPPALRGSILSAIREVRPLPPVETEDTPHAPATRPVVSTSAPPTAEPVIDELAARRQRRPARLLAFAVAAAMVVALALGGWVVNLVQERQAQVAASNTMTELLSAPDVQFFKKTMNGAPVSFVVSKKLDRAVITGSDVPTLPAGQTYQLWTLDGAAAIPNQLFNGGQTVQTWFSGGVQDASAVAVTIEPAAGSSIPTLPTLADASLKV